MGDAWRLIAAAAGFWIWVLIQAFSPALEDFFRDTEAAQTPAVADAIDLGVATYPAGAETYTPTRHTWAFNPKPIPYAVSYAHGKQASGDLQSDHRQLAQRWSFRWATGQRFIWRRPPSCRGPSWDCIYKRIYDRSAADLVPLTRRFVKRAAQENWSRTEIAQWLLAFVQHIEYRVPEDYAFGVLPPALVTSLSYGDCDSKSLLLMQLLAAFGIDSKLVWSAAHEHALVGIQVPSSGDGFDHRGRSYAWAETTALNVPLGWLHPQFKSPDDWVVVQSL